ncbi:hypothetical protein EDI_049430 [Entamoeba dispar SAW760]|uniref:Uncharacterized protein n=1 Tax=Entamoeba dispar (strain ATCC PRA-260 / SAW760) TaxID=370354 RepID=B0EFF3_ENTDS|nr:uncharacterized protein EDI_049430 [Entamoeba dispar SAW760]EDR26732.1 hypothetical protein EDI_049430 [Entamoeba dispar SAW760]|eukprot:EDR26732.1 hypothetical protein EDI_049430 [Entamoeba dispar SAW760]
MQQNKNSFWNSIWKSLEGLTKSMKSLGNIFSFKDNSVECTIVRNKIYEDTLPCLRYLFDPDPPKYHIPLNTQESMDWAVLGMRFLFTDMKYNRCKYDSEEDYDKAIDSIKSLFVEPHQLPITRARKPQHTKVFDDTVLIRNKPLPKASTHYIRRPFAHRNE